MEPGDRNHGGFVFEPYVVKFKSLLTLKGQGKEPVEKIDAAEQALKALAYVRTKRRPQISPLRYAPVEMTILF
jgi:hypothetical protein